MDRKMGVQRWQAENLVSQAKQKLKYDLIEGKVGLDRAYSLVNSMKMVESQWQKMAGSQPRSQNVGQTGGSQPAVSQEKQTSSARLGSFVKEESRQETNQNALASRVKLEEQEREREARKQVKQTLKENWWKDQQAMLDDLSPEDQSILKELSRVEYDLDHGLDRSYENVLQNQLLRDSYRKSLDVHGIRGKDLEDMVRYVQKQQKEYEKEIYQKSWDNYSKQKQKEKEDKKRAEETWSQHGEIDVRAMMDDISAEDLAAIKALNQAQYHLANDNLDRSYENISRNQALAESYLKTLANHGIEGKNLQEMLWMLDMQRDEQLDEKGRQERRDFVDGGYWQGLGSSGLGLLEKALGRTANAMDIAYQIYERKKNDSNFPLNDHVLSNRLINRAEAGQQEAGDKIEQWGTEITGNEMVGEVAKGVYDGFMNTGDILLSALLGAKAGAVINALSGFSEGFWQAKDQGAADDSAFNYALLSQIPQILLDKLVPKYSSNKLSQEMDISQEVLTKLLRNSSTAALGKTMERLLERISLADNDTMVKIYDKAYQEAIDNGAGDTQARFSGIAAQIEYLFRDILVGTMESTASDNLQTLLKRLNQVLMPTIN